MTSRDQFISIYNRLLGSINKIKDQLIDDESASGLDIKPSTHQHIALDNHYSFSPEKPADNESGASRLHEDRASDELVLQQTRQLLASLEENSFKQENRSRSRSRHHPLPQQRITSTLQRSKDQSRESIESSVKSKRRTSEPSSHSKVFDDLLLRLDKLKETLEIDKTADRTREFRPHLNSQKQTPEKQSHPTNHRHLNDSRAKRCNSSEQKNHNFHDCSPISRQNPDSFQDNSKNEILAIIESEKTKIVPPATQLSPKTKSVYDRRYEELEYSPSKKESYGSQIDNFLTTETQMLKSINQRSDQPHAHYQLNSRGHRYEKPLPEVAEESDSSFTLTKKSKQLKPLSQQTLVVSHQFSAKVSENNNPANKENRLPRNPEREIQRQQMSTPYFTKLLSAYSAKYAAEVKNFERREIEFSRIKQFLDSQEAVEKEQSRSKSRSKSKKRLRDERDKQKLKNLQDRADHINKRLNVYDFTFKEEIQIEDTTAPSTLAGPSKVNYNYESATTYSRPASPHKQSARKKDSISTFTHYGSNSVENLPLEQPTSQRYYSSNKSHNSKHDSYRPPVLIEIPLNQYAQQSQAPTLKDAYSQFLQKKQRDASNKRNRNNNAYSFQRQPRQNGAPLHMRSTDSQPHWNKRSPQQQYPEQYLYSSSYNSGIGSVNQAVQHRSPPGNFSNHPPYDRSYYESTSFGDGFLGEHHINKNQIRRSPMKDKNHTIYGQQPAHHSRSNSQTRSGYSAYPFHHQQSANVKIHQHLQDRNSTVTPAHKPSSKQLKAMAKRRRELIKKYDANRRTMR